MLKKLLTCATLLSVATNVFTVPLTVNAADLNEKFPLQEEVEFDVFVVKGPQNVHLDWNKANWIWDNYNEMTNVKMNWNQIPGESAAEQRNLSLVGGELPDIYYSAGFTSADVFRYGQQGVFLPLNELIEEHAPNLAKLLEENPELKKGITFPDGNIYGLPRIFDTDFLSLQIGPFPWVQKSITEELGLTLPESTDQLYDFLKSIKENRSEIVPLAAPGISYLINYFAGSFNVMKNGGGNGPVQLNEEGKVEFYGINDDYRAMLEYLNKLYTEGLIDQNIFSIEWNQFIANRDEDNYGINFFWGPDINTSAAFEEKYEAMLPVSGPEGAREFYALSGAVANNANFIITTNSENPEIAVSWLDYFYSEEGAKFFFLGREGETFEVVDGQPQYMQKVLDEGVANYFPWLGNGQGIIREAAFIGGENSHASKTAAESYRPFINSQPWAAFTYTQEENDFLLAEGADIDKYFQEMRDGFISGEIPFDQWDSYVETLKSIGLDRYVEIKQAAYDRTLAAE